MPNTVPENMKTKEAMDINQDRLAKERTKLSITRTDLAFMNTHMSVSRTHLSYLRTIVSLVVSSATIYKGLPAIGVSVKFATLLSVFLLVFSAYFIYKDATEYPKMKKQLEEMGEKTKQLQMKTDAEIYDIDVEE